MNLKTRKIYEIAKKLFTEKTLAFKEFYNKKDFAPILENPYINMRTSDEIMAFLLFDFKEYEESANATIKNMLKELNCEVKDLESFIKILRESYVSLFRIEKKGDYFLFFDVLLDEYIEVENYTSIEFAEVDFGLCRIFGNDKRKVILHVTQLMVEEVFITFSNNLSNLFYHIEENYGPVTINKDFLKREFLNIISVFEVTFESMYNEILDSINAENDNEINYFEYLLDKFYEEDFLVLQNKDLFKKIFSNADTEFIIEFSINLFSKIYSNCLFEENKTFKDYDLDYKKIFEYLSESGEFLNRKELACSLDFLIIFYGKLLTMGRNVKNILKDLNEIKENIFYYLDLLKNSESGFYFDDDILPILLDNKKFVFGNKFLENFDSFLTFLDMNYVNKLKSGDLSPAMLKKFTESINLVPTKVVKTFKNTHFPLIELYFTFMVKKYLTFITREDAPEELYLTDYADNYQTFDDATKLSIWTESLTNKKFLKSSFGKNYDKYTSFVIDFLKKLNEKNCIKDEKFDEEESSLLSILEDLGLIESKKDFSAIKITNLGKDIFNYYNTEEVNYNNIIKVDFN
ncbi:hypothetical protein [Peptoniphilus porci]|uniref:Uncharacterized protein n=1 Tax=Peptoniphilus porci TaxID=2652280 RepID=A0A1U7M0I8_9FIRM|nr:hypothetical protein [Peptoniphilus porci]OLR65153.1 hypothetical protein BIV18_06300 [Peptoniphilus porci]